MSFLKRFFLNGWLLLVALFFLLLTLRLPTWIAYWQQEGKPLPPVTVVNLEESHFPLIQLPFFRGRQIWVFAHTQCGPCKLELNRLHQLVTNHKVKPEQILVIHLNEIPETVLNYHKENQFLFPVFTTTPANPTGLPIRGTPTILFLDEKNQIRWLTLGNSVTLELRVLNFLADQNPPGRPDDPAGAEEGEEIYKGGENEG